MRAEEFINYEEILATLQYAQDLKDDYALIDEILEKARPVKNGTGYICKGLTHRETSVLLACENPDKIARMFAIAEEIKQVFTAIGLCFLRCFIYPNYCVNGCVCCPYHGQNKHSSRKKLTQAAGSGTYILFQETYHKDSYEKLHPTGLKHNYAWYTEAMDSVMEVGIDDVGLGGGSLIWKATSTNLLGF